VLRKARDVFWRAGYQATSLDRLSDATGLKRPSLYGAFGDKRAMFLAALRAYRTASMARVGEILGEAATLQEALAGVYATAIDTYLPGARGCLILNTAPSEVDSDPEVRAELAGVTADLDRLFAARFARDSRTDASTRGRLATATLHSLSVRARGGATRADLEALAAAAVDWLDG
jgi:AcrR family transcriptional regulator